MSVRVPWLADVLRSAGLSVVETDGWKTLRPDYNLLSIPGAPDTIQGIVCHHTASPSTSTLATNLAVVKNGNTVGPGPIAQLLLWRDGTFYTIAAGKANHAGAGGPVSFIPESPTGTLSLANDRTLGIEAVNNGTGELWAPEMLDAYEAGVAAILTYLGLDESRAITHNEWAPTRKIDPAGPTNGRIAYKFGLTWSGDSWRSRIKTHFPAPTPDPTPVPPTPPNPVYDDDMATLYRDSRYNNVFLVNGDVTTVGPNLFDSLVARQVPVVVDTHDQSLISFMRKSQIKVGQLVQSGTPGPFNAPADLQGT